MKDFSYKDYILDIEELSNFHLSKIFEENKYRGTFTINGKRQIKETSTTELLISWFKYTVDYLNETILYDQICKSWGSSYKKIEYKGRYLVITVRKRYKDSKAIYLGEFFSKDYKCIRSIESVHYDKVTFRFEKFVDEYCTDWIEYKQFRYKNYVIDILQEKSEENYIGYVYFHDNSIYKYIADTIEEVERCCKNRIGKAVYEKEKVKPVSSKLDKLVELTEELGLYEYF